MTVLSDRSWFAYDAATTRESRYVGLATGEDGEEKPGQDLATRLAQSLSRFFWLQQRHVYSDVWDVVVRWAPLDPRLVQAVEGILLVAHAPPFSTQLVRTAVPERDADIVVLNTGNKGTLLPCVAGAYYCASANVWPGTPGGD
jgi:hypothetical protein